MYEVSKEYLENIERTARHAKEMCLDPSYNNSDFVDSFQHILDEVGRIKANEEIECQ